MSPKSKLMNLVSMVLEDVFHVSPEHGNIFPSSKHPSLGNWIAKLRATFRKGKLSKERIDLLESLVGWDWEPQKDS